MFSCSNISAKRPAILSLFFLMLLTSLVFSDITYVNLPSSIVKGDDIDPLEADIKWNYDSCYVEYVLTWKLANDYPAKYIGKSSPVSDCYKKGDKVTVDFGSIGTDMIPDAWCGQKVVLMIDEYYSLNGNNRVNIKTVSSSSPQKMEIKCGECDSNSDCDDDEICYNGECEEIDCKKDKDCGDDDWTGSAFCKDGNLYKKWKEWDCENPGKIDADCDSDTDDELFQDCGGLGCSNNKCNSPAPSCSAGTTCKDSTHKAYQYSDCSWGSTTYCQYGCTNNDCKAAPVPSCSTGTKCKDSGNKAYQYSDCTWGSATSCQYGCSNGACNSKPDNIACFTKSDCSADGLVGAKFCNTSDGNLYQEYDMHTCVYAGTKDSFCFIYSAQNQKVQTCTNGCSNGACKAAPSCSSGTKCKDANNKAYQYSDCSWGSATYCQYGCANNDCKVAPAPSCSAGTKCKDSSNKAYQYSDCSWGSATSCQYGCSNGACNSKPVSIACYKNSDCGTNAYIDPPVCSMTGNVIQLYNIYTCQNNGTANAKCTSSTQNQLAKGITNCNGLGCSNGACKSAPAPSCSVGTKCKDANNKGYQNSNCVWSNVAYCQYGCSNGACNSKPVSIACYKNSDCGTNSNSGLPLCSGNNIIQKSKNYTCQNPGTASATCLAPVTMNNIIKSCSSKEVCVNGTCKLVACFNNSDCGTNAFVSMPFCNINAVYQPFTTFTCSNKGTVSAKCFNNTANKFKFNCLANETCSNGVCQPKKPPICSKNSDCGIDGLIGSPYCSSTSVVNQTYKLFICQGVGTPNAYCQNFTKPTLIKNCKAGEVCSNGACTSPASGGWKCKDTFTAALQNPDGTWTVFEQFCPNGCVDGACKIECTKDADCGGGKYLSESVCYSANPKGLFKGYEGYKCYNAGATNSYCAGISAMQQVGTCTGTATCNGGICGVMPCHVGQQVGSKDYCSATCKCGIKEGHCDSDAECKTGLACAKGIGVAYGFSGDTGVCIEPVSINELFPLEDDILFPAAVIGAVEGTQVIELMKDGYYLVAYEDAPAMLAKMADVFNEPALKSSKVAHYNVKVQFKFGDGTTEVFNNHIAAIQKTNNGAVEHKFYLWESKSNTGKIVQGNMDDLRQAIMELDGSFLKSKIPSSSVWAKVWSKLKLTGTTISNANIAWNFINGFTSIIWVPEMAEVLCEAGANVCTPPNA